MSNGKWIYVMFMILMITSHTRTDDDATTDELQKLKVYHPPKDKICAKELHTFIDLNTTIESYILVMGKTKKRVLLITKSLFVYDVPHDFFDPVGVAVYLKYMPTPMKDKYPVLYYDPLFQSIKNEISAWITYDSDGDWICMTSNDSKQGINYNIDKSEVHKGFVLSGEWPETLIPTQEPCKFYSIQRRIDKVNIISTTKTALWLTVYKCKNGDRIINSNGIEKVTDFRMLCYNGFDVWITKAKKCERFRALEWPFGSGFVCDGKFFIIGVVAVYVLSENLFNQAGKSFPGGEYYPHHFYNCTGIIPPNKVIFKSYFYWIIAAIILLVIIISSVYVAHRSLANRKKTRSGLERSSKISLSKSSIKVASKRSLKSKSKRLPDTGRTGGHVFLSELFSQGLPIRAI
uniref:Uncharacterized protein LOC113798264 n=1 Tax=Dermatophagoides pteronyssinus TaxID=6956 RepID=A0A6P6YH75_DERPT|nr:uncharacterized protein LOC113798264 [Dermatophagoides pteronyssinus]